MTLSLNFDSSLDRTAPHHLAALCSVFEERWLAGDPPDISEFLDRTRQHDRSTLLAQLIRIDVRERLRHGETPNAHEYVTRFPDDQGTILGINWASLTSQVPSPPSAEDIVSVRAFRRSRIGRFDLLERLGIGGFGEVWRAFDTHLQRDVAIKIGHFGTDDTEQVHLLLHEARSAGRLRHPGLVPVHEAAVEDRIAYIVSDYIPGKTLAARLKEGRLSCREAAVIAHKLADAVAHAHENGVIHRDIKPANVLLDQTGDPHLADFGVARRISGDATISTEGEALGTPAYMAPEQARGEVSTADHRADVYSIGILLYELVAGRRAYPGDAREALQRVLLGPPQRLRLFRHDVPQDLETIVNVAIAREANDRYQTAKALADDLGRFLRGEPIVARNSGPLKRTWRWICRRPAAMTVAILPFLLAGSTWIAAQGFDADLRPDNGNRTSVPDQPVEVPPPPPAPPEIAGEAHAKLLEAANAADYRIECRLVELRTDPPGADVWLFPLDPRTGMVQTESLIDPKANSPVRLNLPIGSYHVVADLGGGRFAEVVRRVPPTEEPPLVTFESVAWRPIVGGVAVSLKIPPAPKIDELVYVEGGELAIARGAGGESIRVHVPPFYLAPHELTFAEHDEIIRGLGGLTRQRPPNERPLILEENQFVPGETARLYFFEAERVAHWNGMRLPDEFEWEIAARLAGEPNWDAISAELPDEGFGPPGTPSSDRTDTLPAIVGLRSNVAEWTSSWFDASSGDEQFPPAVDRDPVKAKNSLRYDLRLRVIRGGDLATIAGDPGVTPVSRAIDNRIGGCVDEPCLGVGCRLARSIKPRRAPEDFARILTESP